MPKILLLSCCAPCSCAVIEKLARDGADFTVLFYNPNIHPADEYEKRRKENEDFCSHRHIPFISLEYDPGTWHEAIKGLENEPERGQRCSACFLMRLRRTAAYAKENGFDVITSVLGISRYKDFDQVTTAGHRAAREYGISYDDTNWRKGGLEQERQNLVRRTQMYAQDYCGCIYSKRR